MIRNQAGQIVDALLLDATDGSAETSGATVKIKKGTGDYDASAGTLVHKTGGAWQYQPTQAETDDAKVCFLFEVTGGVSQLVQAFPAPAVPEVVLTSAYDAAKTAASQASVDALPTATENADAILKRDWTAVTGEASRSVLNALRVLRNAWAITSGAWTIAKEDDETPAFTKPVTPAPGADPISGVGADE